MYFADIFLHNTYTQINTKGELLGYITARKRFQYLGWTKNDNEHKWISAVFNNQLSNSIQVLCQNQESKPVFVFFSNYHAVGDFIECCAKLHVCQTKTTKGGYEQMGGIFQEEIYKRCQKIAYNNIQYVFFIFVSIISHSLCEKRNNIW